VVPADQGREIPLFLLAILRNEPRGDGRLGFGDGGG